MTTRKSITVRIQRTDDEQRIVYGEVYAPLSLDTYGEFMFGEDVRLMAYRFMQLDLSKTIDTSHDNIPNGSFPIESFIARAEDPDFKEGAWVLGVKVPSDDIWQRVKDGELNGFSFQAMVKPVEYDIEYPVVRDVVGETEATEDHAHLFVVEIGDDGRVKKGMTSTTDGHFHEILSASVTKAADGHTHRFFLE